MSRAMRWLLGLGVWTLLAALSASQTIVRRSLADRPIDWAELVPDALVGWYSCAIFTPVFFWAARRFPVDTRHWLKRLPWHLALCAAASVGKFAVEWTVMTQWLRAYEVPFARMLSTGFISENIAFWCMAAAIHAIEFHRRARDRELLTSRLQTRLSAAQLESLAARLQPHFLFNTLQGISTLVHRDPNAADRMLGHLSTLLRTSLRSQTRHEVTLAEELASLDDYLAIITIRFGDRVCIDRQIESEALSGLVPSFSLQPLVENAVQHGIARHAGAGRIAITARRDNEQLILAVEDDGSGPPANVVSDGVGLGATRARLTELYGGTATLQVRARPLGGTVATMVVPFRTTAAPEFAEAVG